MEVFTLDFLARWGHGVFGITWIGMLYYFNFVQGAYFKQATPEALSDAKAKLAPSALWWFRWGAMFTFLTGLILLHSVGARFNSFLLIGALLGTLMFLNVWLVIWPKQQIALGLVESSADAGQAAAKALLASRTNTMFSLPMLFGMFGSMHGAGQGMMPLTASSASMVGPTLAVIIILALEGNALAGKMGPITTVRGVIISSVILTVVLVGIVQYL